MNRSALSTGQTRTFFLSLLCLASIAPATAQTVVPIETKALREIALYPQRDVIATIVGRNESKLAAEVAGTVLRWTADVGASVKRGDVLVVLDTTDAKLAIDRAQAALDAAQARATLSQAQLKRARELKEQGFISADALLQRETEAALTQTDIAANKAQMATAQRALAKATLRAPFDGTIKQRMVQMGESVAPGSVLYVLTEARAPELTAAVMPADVPTLRRAKDISFAVLGLSMPATIARVSSSIALPARTQEVRLRIGKEGDDLPVGSEGQLQWKDSVAHIPASFLVQRGAQIGVFTTQAGKAKFVALQNAQEGRAAATTLPPDTLVVARGAATLQDGQSLPSK